MAKKGGHGLSDEDKRIWENYAQGVEKNKKPIRSLADHHALNDGQRLPENLRAKQAEPKRPAVNRMASATPAIRPMAADPRSHSPYPVTDSRSSGGFSGLDRRNAERLRRGKLRIDGRMDLHGMTQEHAHTALIRFIRAGVGTGKRCVLVITGKGKRGIEHEPGFMPSRRGILRELVPQWLADPHLARHIAAVTPAAQHHGGSGALYVYLRRNGPAL